MPAKKDKQLKLNFQESAILLHSVLGLADIELNRLSRAANLRKEISELVQQWVDAIAEARFARWVAEYKELLEKSSGMVITDEGADLEEVFKAERTSAL